MTRDSPVPDDVAGRFGSGAQHRCVCCDRVIASLPDEVLSMGLNTTLGLVSEECALICNGCTAGLMEAAARVTGRRK
jgi:predicted Rossmann-fold nucleotide-binding protein